MTRSAEMVTQPRLAIIGDSHANALLGGVRMLQRSQAKMVLPIVGGMVFTFPSALARFHHAGPAITFDAAKHTEALYALTGHRTISRETGDLYGIVLPYTTSMIVWSETWKSHCLWRSGNVGKAAISDAVFRRIVEDHFSHIVQFIDDLRSADIPFFVVEAAPIRSDDRSIKKRSISAEEALMIDTAARSTVDDILFDMGIDIVRCPESTYEGLPRASFLKQSMRASRKNDTHHANAVYGVEMLAAITSYCRERVLTELPKDHSMA